MFNYSSTSSSLTDSDRFSLVSSLYGPGSIGCWLCTLASVFVTWALNVNCRCKDSITNDLIATLAIPAVAAGHVVFRLFFSDAPRSHFYGSRSMLLTSTQQKIVQFAAAVEAPLNVCETFSMAALALFPIAVLWGHWKRAVSILVVGLLCFSIESIIFFQAPGVGTPLSNLSRPYLFNFFEIMVSIFAFLTVSLVFFFVILVAAPAKLPRRREQGANTEIEGRTRSEAVFLTSGESNAIRRLLPYATFIVVPFAMASTIFNSMGVFGTTSYMDSKDWASRIPFFIPKSSNSLTELDQAVSLSVGIITLLFSLHDAYKSRRRAVERRLAEEVELAEHPRNRRGL